jgi:copper transport protein
MLLVPRLAAPMRALAPTLETIAAATGAWGAFALAVVAAPRLWLQARGLVDAGDPVWPMAANVLATTWGRGWMLQSTGAALAGAGFFLAMRGRRSAWGLVLMSALAIAIASALMGHAAATSRFHSLSVGGDALHVLSAGAWIGTLLVIARAFATRRGRSDAGELLAALVEAFHRVALASATHLLGSGVASVLIRVERIRDQPGSAYGNTLIVKLVLVAVVAAFGAAHARGAARTARAGATRTVARSLAVELSVAALAIATTAVLVGTEPPGPP